MDLKDKVAILTGASSGLGSAIAEKLIEKNVKVYGLARNIDALTEVEKKLGANFKPVRMDITNQEMLNDWINNTFSNHNIPDILINNAGAGSFNKIDEMPAEEWLGMVNTNLNGLYFITSPIAALMKNKSSSTHILNIGSVLGSTGRSNGAAYCATKFGVSGFSEALFKELRFYDIKVTCFNPGSIATEFFESSGIDSHQNMLHPKDLADSIIHVLQTPDNMLINELTVRPLNPKPPRKE